MVFFKHNHWVRLDKTCYRCSRFRQYCNGNSRRFRQNSHVQDLQCSGRIRHSQWSTQTPTRWRLCLCCKERYTWTYLLWQDNWCNLYVDYFAQTKVISLKHKGYELIIFCFCFKEPRTIYEGPNFWERICHELIKSVSF